MSYSSAQYIIQDGDSIYSIAQKLLGDSSRGLEIAILNDLEYPFIVSLGDVAGITYRNVVTTGDSIKIPGEGSQLIEAEDLDLEIYGGDILLYKDSNDPFSGGEFTPDVYGDIQYVKGINCLKQDLFCRLMTEQGSLINHPTWGSNFLSIIGNKKDTNWKQRAIVEITRVFRSDNRVSDVQDVSITEIPTGYILRCSIITINSKILFEERV